MIEAYRLSYNILSYITYIIGITATGGKGIYCIYLFYLNDFIVKEQQMSK